MQIPEKSICVFCNRHSFVRGSKTEFAARAEKEQGCFSFRKLHCVYNAGRTLKATVAMWDLAV